MINILFFFMFLVAFSASHRIEGIQNQLNKELIHTLRTDNTLTNHVAKATVVKGSYHGVSGRNSIYNPKVKNDQSSSAFLWVQSGSGDNTHKIVFGWHVLPKLYGDNKTHIFAAWTKDNFKTTGCINYGCGFVQVSRSLRLERIISPTSIYGGPLVEISLSIFEDLANHNWYVSLEGTAIGYFPASMFPNIVADQVGWGGITSTSVGSISPPMGSGYFPEKLFNHGCYFRKVAFRDARGSDNGPSTKMVQSFSDKTNCYGANYYEELEKMFGFSFEFGGPGGNCSH